MKSSLTFLDPIILRLRGPLVNDTTHQEASLGVSRNHQPSPQNDYATPSHKSNMKGRRQAEAAKDAISTMTETGASNMWVDTNGHDDQACDSAEPAATTFHNKRRRRRRRMRSSLSSSSYACCTLLLAAAASTCCSSTVLAAEESPQQNRRLRRGRNHHQTTHRNRNLQTTSPCPPYYTGKVPTPDCTGYVTCTSGNQISSSQDCAAGTLFDVNGGGCTWPEQVDCRNGDELIDQLGIQMPDNGNGEGEGETPQEGSQFCPANHNGRAPTANCAGYVQCTNGKEGLYVSCPPRSQFSIVTNLCEYNIESCQMLVGENPQNNDEVIENELNVFCPEGYTGRAPTHACRGYVDCKNGEARVSTY